MAKGNQRLYVGPCPNPCHRGPVTRAIKKDIKLGVGAPTTWEKRLL